MAASIRLKIAGFRADAECERQHGHRREAGILASMCNP